MTANVTTAFWSMTINNPDETDMALVRNGYADYCRELIHTLEVGKEGTPHVQAWVKLQRQQRMSFMRKLFPRGHFKPLTCAEYVLNTKMYAQKDDDTTAGAHVHVYHDPIDTIESVVRQVATAMVALKDTPSTLIQRRAMVESDMVRQDYKKAKMFVGATYKAMWNRYAYDILYCISNTHAEEESSAVIYTTNGEDRAQGEGLGGGDCEGGSQVSEGDDYEECASEASEGSDESGSDESDEEDDSSESGE